MGKHQMMDQHQQNFSFYNDSIDFKDFYDLTEPLVRLDENPIQYENSLADASFTYQNELSFQPIEFIDYILKTSAEQSQYVGNSPDLFEASRLDWNVSTEMGVVNNLSTNDNINVPLDTFSGDETLINPIEKTDICHENMARSFHDSWTTSLNMSVFHCLEPNVLQVPILTSASPDLFEETKLDDLNDSMDTTMLTLISMNDDQNESNVTIGNISDTTIPHRSSNISNLLDAGNEDNNTEAHNSNTDDSIVVLIDNYKAVGNHSHAELVSQQNVYPLQSMSPDLFGDDCDEITLENIEIECRELSQAATMGIRTQQLSPDLFESSFDEEIEDEQTPLCTNQIVYSNVEEQVPETNANLFKIPEIPQKSLKKYSREEVLKKEWYQNYLLSEALLNKSPAPIRYENETNDVITDGDIDLDETRCSVST